jgi:2-keto-4-pentenoate hydratase
MAMTEFDSVANRFVAARRTAQGLADYPGRVPETLAEAYQIQDAAITAYAVPIAGWKVGRILPPWTEHFGDNRLAGPIFTGTAHAAGDDRAGLIFAEGFGAAEAEFLFRVGTAPASGRDSFDLDEVAALIDAVHIGIEIASSPLATINSLGSAVTISDFGNNNGLLIGDAVVNWREGNYAEQEVATYVDGERVGSGQASAFPDGPLGSVRFLLEHLIRRGMSIQPGWWISTGAVTGVHRVRVGQSVRADFGALGEVHCRIDAQLPTSFTAGK